MALKLSQSFLHSGVKYELIVAEDRRSIYVRNTPAPYCFTIHSDGVSAIGNFHGPDGAFIKNDYDTSIKDLR